MSRRSPRLVAVLLAALCLPTAACGATPLPTATGTEPPPSDAPDMSLPTGGESASPDESTAASPDATFAADQDLAGPWSREPFQLGDSQVAILSDACAAAAREHLGEDQANLPTAFVDARGRGLMTAILSDDADAVVCAAHLDAGGSPTVDSVDQLATTRFDQQAGSGLGVTELTRISGPPGDRTLAFGRAGPDATNVRLGLDDQTAVTSAVTNGWWLAWWPGSQAIKSFSALDANGGQVGSAPAPQGEVESRLGPASWWLDPQAPEPAADATSIAIKVLEGACASGGAGGRDRLDAPSIVLTDTTITVTLAIRRQPGAQDCQGNAPFSFDLELPEPLGSRKLLDGGEHPPRDVSKPPSG